MDSNCRILHNSSIHSNFYIIDL